MDKMNNIEIRGLDPLQGAGGSPVSRKFKRLRRVTQRTSELRRDLLDP
jgi:hypothetical protein